MMGHLDEHTLEMLVLRGGRAANRDREIEEHLAGCSRCTHMLEKITAYYEEAEKEAGKPVSDKGSDTHSVSRRRRQKPAVYFSDPRRSATRYTEVSLPSAWHRAGRFARGHPVVSSFFALVLIGLGWIFFSYLPVVRPNISYYYYNRTGHRLEAYSSSNKLLWALPSFGLPPDLNQENRSLAKLTALADLENNGRNDLITLVPIGGETSQNTLKIINPLGKVVKTFRLGGGHVVYDSVHYVTPFELVGVFKETMPNGKLNLFVTADNRRSPTVLLRLDSKLKIIGEYWHYGSMTCYPVRGYAGGPRQIISVGSHDTEDMKGMDYSFMSVLDPSKIVGDRESSATPGFGKKVSSAEKYYVRFPLTDLGRATGQRLTSYLFAVQTDSVLDVAVQTSMVMSKPESFGFTYIFNRRNMTVSQVKFIMPTAKTYELLKSEGKVHGTFGPSYLDSLKEGVRYWDGKEWVKRATKVKPG